MTHNEWQCWINAKQDEYGEKFTLPDPQLCNLLVPYLKSGKRVEIDVDGFITRGFISITCGWWPSFMVLRTSRSMGSWILISKNTRILRELNY